MRPAIKLLIEEAKSRTPFAIPDPAPIPVTTRLEIHRYRADASQSTIGAMAELSASVDLMNRGFEVYRALSPNAPCDLIATKGEAVIRIEVKATVIRNCKIVARSANKNSKVEHIALVLRDGRVFYRPKLPAGA